MHPQIYGLPGDFDLNGVVNGADLTDATLGFNTRFGSDLDGSDFLVWQRNFGNGMPSLMIKGGQEDPAEVELAPAIEGAIEVEQLAAVEPMNVLLEADDAPRMGSFAASGLAGLTLAEPVRGARPVRTVRPAAGGSAMRQSTASSASGAKRRDFAAATVASDELLETYDAGVAARDEAFAEFGLGVLLAV